jgi:hypothetical protein
VKISPLSRLDEQICIDKIPIGSIDDGFSTWGIDK